jgi:hypothetical protein
MGSQVRRRRSVSRLGFQHRGRSQRLGSEGMPDIRDETTQDCIGSAVWLLRRMVLTRFTLVLGQSWKEMRSCNSRQMQKVGRTTGGFGRTTYPLAIC